MGVVDVRGKGGKLPEPEGEEGKPSQGMEGKDDPVREVEQATVRGARLRAFREAAGIGEPGERTSATEKVGIDLGTIFQSQAKLVEVALDKLNELATRSPSAAQDPELSRLREELRETKDRMERALSERKTPVETLQEAMTLMDEMASRFKQRLGVPQATPAGSQDLSLLIQLEDVKQQGEDRRRQWETDMEERRQQWNREQRRWEEEFRLKRMEFFDGRRSRDRATEALTDLAGALIDGIEQERSLEAPAEGQPAAQPVARKPKSFKCPDCQGVVHVPSPESKEATCESCGAVFSLETKA